MISTPRIEGSAISARRIVYWNKDYLALGAARGRACRGDRGPCVGRGIRGKIRGVVR
jgi:hypothetical protein